MAVANGLAIAQQANLLRNGDTVLVQTDNDGVMGVLEGTTQREVTLSKKRARKDMTWKEFRNQVKATNREIRQVTDFYRKILGDAGIKVIWRHCKGHAGKNTARAAVNTDCDRRAKAKMQMARREHLRERAIPAQPVGVAPTCNPETPIAA